MDDNGLPCLDMLEATPTIHRFSVDEVLAHLGFLDLQPALRVETRLVEASG